MVRMGNLTKEAQMTFYFHIGDLQEPLYNNVVIIQVYFIFKVAPLTRQKPEVSIDKHGLRLLHLNTSFVVMNNLPMHNR